MKLENNHLKWTITLLKNSNGILTTHKYTYNQLTHLLNQHTTGQTQRYIQKLIQEQTITQNPDHTYTINTKKMYENLKKSQTYQTIKNYIQYHEPTL